jgi:hypothetical protein
MKTPKPMPGIEAALKFAAVYLRAIDAPKAEKPVRMLSSDSRRGNRQINAADYAV